MVFDESQIEALLPHAGSMCLLSSVRRWDDTHIECEATSHRDTDNPLRHGGVLPIHAGVEYAAQAAGLHGGLQSGGGPPRRGYLAVLNNVLWHAERLDDIDAALRIVAEKRSATAGGAVYAFTVHGDGRLLLHGEVVIALESAQEGSAA